MNTSKTTTQVASPVKKTSPVKPKKASTMDTKKFLQTTEFQYSTEANIYMNRILTIFIQKIIGLTGGKNIFENIQKILPKYIANGAQYFISNAIKNNKHAVPINKILKEKLSPQDNKVLCYVIEYLSTEILELAKNHVRDANKKRILQKHIEYVIGNDAELKDVF